MAKSKIKAQILYGIISLTLILISLIGLAFNSIEAVVILSICSVFCYFALLINLYSGTNREKNTLFSVLLISFVRFLLLGAGLILSAIFLYFNNNEGDNYRYLFLLFGLIPIFISNLTFYLGSKDE